MATFFQRRSRRTGRIAKVLIVVAVLLAAGLAVAAYFILPALGVGQYTATAMLQVSMFEPTVLSADSPARWDRERFEIFKQTQEQLMLSDRVMRVALLRPEITSVHRLRDLADPVAWLKKRLSVTFPGKGEVMEVSFTGDDPKEAKDIVNAVVNTYIRDIVDCENEQKRARLTLLEGICEEKERTIRRLREELKGLAGDWGIAEPGAFDVRQKLLMEDLSSMNTELVKFRFEAARLMGELDGQKVLLSRLEQTQPSAIDADDLIEKDPLAKQLAVELVRKKAELPQADAAYKSSDKEKAAEPLRGQIKRLQEEYDRRLDELRQTARDRQRAKIQREITRLETLMAVLRQQGDALAKDIDAKRYEAMKFGRTSVDYDMKRSELANLERAYANVVAEKEKLRAELQARQRIRLLSMAEEPLS